MRIQHFVFAPEFHCYEIAHVRIFIILIIVADTVNTKTIFICIIGYFAICELQSFGSIARQLRRELQIVA